MLASDDPCPTNELFAVRLQGPQTQLQCESWLQWSISSNPYVDRWMNGDVGRKIDAKQYYFTFLMNYENCPRPGWLNYPASFSAPAAWYHQQSRKSTPAKYAASGHRDPSQAISQASFWKGIAFLTRDEWEWRTRNIQKGHVRSSATSRLPGNGLYHFKYWLFFKYWW